METASFFYSLKASRECTYHLYLTRKIDTIEREGSKDVAFSFGASLRERRQIDVTQRKMFLPNCIRFLCCSSTRSEVQQIFNYVIVESRKKHVRNLFWGNGTENTARHVLDNGEQKKHVLLCKMSPASHFFLFEKGEKNNK